MATKTLFLTFESVDARSGSKSIVSVPLSQVREIKGWDFGAIGNDHLAGVRASVQMAGKEGTFYWTTASRKELVDQANGLT